MTEDQVPKKKKKWDEMQIVGELQADDLIVELPAPVVVSTPEYYTAHLWDGGPRVVYKCGTCGTFRDDTDSMVEHLLLHYPVSDQEFMLERLLAYKPKEV